MAANPALHTSAIAFPVLPRALLLAGPTAVGKSDVAMLLAEKLHGEIISVDSMQVYRGMDIGTAKPSPECRHRVPHHLIDVVDVAEPFDVAQFLRAAHGCALAIESRGHIPILCGGTGLYFKAFLHGLGTAPPACENLRVQLEQTPLSELLRELAVSDPSAYERIDRNNRRRVVRALEVVRLTGRPFSEQRSDWKNVPPNTSVLSVTLSRALAELRRRIDARVDDMFERGLVAETEVLLKHGLAKNPTAMQALGYRQVIEHLNAERSLSETIDLVKIRTRQFAKRQITWFRHQFSSSWFSIEAGMPLESVAERVAAEWRLQVRAIEIDGSACK